MSGFKLEKENVSAQYFGTSNTFKLTITFPDMDEFGNIYYYTESLWIDPHNEDLDKIINILQEAKQLL